MNGENISSRLTGYDEVSWLSTWIRDAPNELKAVTHSNEESSIKIAFSELFKTSHIFNNLIDSCGRDALEF